MPTYEYKCSACDHAFERFQSITARPIRKCPVCGKSKVKRLLGTGAGLIFKGSGFYITDYRSDNYQKSAKADGGSTSTASSDGKAPDNGKATTERAAPKKAKTESKPAAAKPE